MSASLFVAHADPRSPNQKRLSFLVKADSHRDAWKIARKVCATGQGALCRDPVTHELHARPMTPAAYTVRRILATGINHRGRPPKLTADDLTLLAQERGVKIPPRVMKVLEALG